MESVEKVTDVFKLERRCKHGNTIYGLWSCDDSVIGYCVERAKEHLKPGNYKGRLAWTEQGCYLPHYEILGEKVLISCASLVPDCLEFADDYYMAIVTAGQDYSLLQNQGHTDFAITTKLNEFIDISIVNDFYTKPIEASYFSGMVSAGLRLN